MSALPCMTSTGQAGQGPLACTAIDRFLMQAEDARGHIKAHLATAAGARELPEKLWGSLLPVDDECDRCLSPAYSDYSCKMCEQLGRLFILRPEEPFVIRCGRFVGRKLVVRARGSVQARARIDPGLAYQAQHILTLAPLLGDCGYATASQYLVCDPVSCEVLARSVINESALTNSYLVTAFRCRHRLYLLEENALSWSEYLERQPRLGPRQCIDILTQLLANLKLLGHMHFTAGRLDHRSVLVIDDTPSAMVEGRHVQGALGFAIGWTPGSNLTVGETRICTASTPEVSWAVHPRLQLRKLALGETVLTLFNIDAGSRALFLRHRQAGIPLYPGSLEVYALLVTLMVQVDIHKLVMSSMPSLWSRLWVGTGDLDAVNAQLEQWRTANHLPQYEEILDLLQGRWLRCDALEAVWAALP